MDASNDLDSRCSHRFYMARSNRLITSVHDGILRVVLFRVISHSKSFILISRSIGLT